METIVRVNYEGQYMQSGICFDVMNLVLKTDQQTDKQPSKLNSASLCLLSIWLLCICFGSKKIPQKMRNLSCPNIQNCSKDKLKEHIIEISTYVEF